MTLLYCLLMYYGPEPYDRQESHLYDLFPHLNVTEPPAQG